MELWLLCVATPKFSTVQRPFNTGLVNQHSQQLAVNNSLYNGGTGHNRGQSRNYLCRAFNMGKCFYFLVNLIFSNDGFLPNNFFQIYFKRPMWTGVLQFKTVFKSLN
jgi:hypothetical protein